MRMVEPADWDLAGMADWERRNRLLNPLSPSDLIAKTVAEARDAIPRITARWQTGCDMRDCERPKVVIPIHPNTFDAFFNGRSGYRAQYYLSKDEGVAFNDLVLDGLMEPIHTAYEAEARKYGWTVAERCLRGPWRKLWVFGDGAAFDGADPREFRPRRWAEKYPACHWLRAPRPVTTAIEVIGCWMHMPSGELREDPTKADRHDRIYEQGGA